MTRSRLLAIALLTACFVPVLACSSSEPSGPNASATSTSVPGGTTPGGAGVPGTAASSAGTVASNFVLRSSAFGDGDAIPAKYACAAQGGTDTSPPLEWSGTPPGTTTLILVVHDPDAPVAGGFTHLVTSFPGPTTSIADGANSAEGPMKPWRSPCPPSGTHHYTFTLYAFGSDVTLPFPLDKGQVDAVAGKALGTARLTGLFTHTG